MAKPEPRIILAAPIPLGNADSVVTATIPTGLVVGGLLIPRSDLAELSPRVFVQFAVDVTSPTSGLIELWLALVRDDGSVEDLRSVNVHRTSDATGPTRGKHLSPALEMTARLRAIAFPCFQLVGRVSAGSSVVQYPTLLLARRPT